VRRETKESLHLILMAQEKYFLFNFPRKKAEGILQISKKHKLIVFINKIKKELSMLCLSP
jgi:hypothetical protein